jgi:hypothetical protein
MRNLASAFGRLLHWWWRVDRIRTPPGDGRLLRLAPADFVRIVGESAEVRSREVIEGDAPAIVYRCETATATVELVVRLADGELAVVLRRGGQERQLTVDDVEAIPGAACSRRSNF